MPEPVNLTQKEISEYEAAAAQSAPAAAAAAAAAPAQLNPIRDLSADELYDLATKDKEGFDVVNEFRRNKPLWGDPNLVQKVADVHDRVKERGFQMSDLPGPGKIASTALDIAKGFGKQAWNYANALVGVPIASAIGEVTGDSKNPGFNTELAQEGQRRVMENLAGTEGAVVGMMHTGQKAVRKVINAAAGYSGAEDKATPEQKVQNLWNDVGMGETEEEALKGKGGLLTPIGANVREELEAAGKPIRPEETQALSAGDPLSFYTFGKAFQGAGKIVPAPVGAAVDNVVSKAGDIAETIAGKAVKGAGKLTELGGKATKFAGPTVGLIKGAIEAGPLGALAGLKGGEIAAKAGAKISKVGEKVAAMGDEIAGKAPVTTGTAQLVKDVAGSVPAAAAEVGKGAAFDIGTAAVSSESPQDTESTGIGTFFGGLGAAKRVGGRVMSGQIVGPREWGSNTFVGSSGQHQALEHMHIEAIKDATPAVKTRVNAIREFLKGTGANTDVFLAKDPASMEKALVDSGVKPDQAKTFADQEGFVLTNLPGKDGKPRRVILANNIDAAPHEAFHAIQDVLGETANQQIDQIVRQEYGNQWETLGQRYADRIQPGGDWRETVLDSTGTGLNYAKEKIAMNVGNEYRAATGAEPTSDYVQARTKEIFGQVMDKAVQANPNIDPNQIAQHAWRDVLSPQEATAVADTYLSRELAAENFDMVFKNLGASLNNQGLVGRLARVVANLVSTLGGEPLSPERRSQIGDIAPKFRVAEAVRTAPELVTPKVQKAPSEGKKITLNEPLLPSPKINEPSPADEARQIASDAAKAAPKSGTASPREVLGSLAEAIAQKSGVKINYLSAPGEPAAATSSNREARRTTIEAFRKMPPEARVMWEKNFFPERVIKLRGDKYQVMGWAPEVFAANAHKLAEKLVELGVADASPYPIADGTFTPDGWKQLYDDTQKFVKNQMAGRTGAGEPLVVPKNVTDAGFFAPAQRSSPAGLEQTKADFINMLFNFRLPDNARVQKGKMPLNIAGQDVSEATKPGRTEIPIIPRGQFTGEEAQRQGIEGRDIKEVNPLRQQIEAAAQAKGVAMPEFIEAIQRLNVENIKDVKITPEQPQFRGNTLTLSAGFQPSAKPRAIKLTAVKDENGKVHEGFWHGDAQEKAQASGAKGPFADGFVTNSGEFLTRPEAFERAKEIGQIEPDAKPGIMSEEGPGLENSQLMGKKPMSKEQADAVSAQFQPPKTSQEAEELVKSVAKMSPSEFYGWAHNTPGGMTEAAHQTGLNAGSQGFVNLLKAASDSFGKKASDLAATDIEAAMNVATQQQFFREAWEAATGEGSAGYAFRKENPNWKPKFPLNVNTSETILQKKVLDSGTENAHNGENMSTQLQPKTAKKEFKMKPAKGGFSKAWILPDGTPVQLGGQWHHDFINESPELRKKYDLPVDDNTEQNRTEALKAGFVRVNWADASGRMTIEAREKDWPRQRDAVRSMVERNADKIDHIKVHLFNDSVSEVNHSDDAKVFALDDIEKPAMIPFLDLGDKRATGDASDRLFQKAVERSQNVPAKIPSGKDNAYWFGPKGEVYDAPDGHEMKVYELSRDNVIKMDLDKLAREMDAAQAKGQSGSEIMYKEMDKRKFLRAYNVGDKEMGVEGPGRWEHLPRATREAIEDAAIEAGRKVYYNNKPIDTTNVPEVGAMFQPKSVKDVAEEYAKRAKIEYAPSTTRADVPEETAKKVADFYEVAKDAPDSPEVKKSYDALVKETMAQYRTIKAGGYDIEPWSGKGEPYDSSAAMIKDVNENKHLYFLPTKGNFKGSEKNPMLEPSGEGDLLVNDIFRAVHDFFGHAKENLQFGPKGEFNAWRVHSEMYSPEAQGALAAETLAQNFWVNYGKHLRRPDASIPKRGEQDFRPLADRPFAEQKNIVIPKEMLNEVRAQFQPSGGDENPRAIRSVATRFPSGKVYESSGSHADSTDTGLKSEPYKDAKSFEELNNLSTRDFDAFENSLEHGFVTNDGEFLNREEAFKRAQETKQAYKPGKEIGPGMLGAGEVKFQPEKSDKEKIVTAAVQFPSGKVVRGETHEEAITKAGYDGIEDAPEVKGFVTSKGRFVNRFEAMKIAKEAGQITEADLINPNARALHTLEFNTRASRKDEVKPSDDDPDSLTGRFQPRRGDEDLFGNKQMFSPREVSEMSPDEIKEFFPEAVVPSKAKELISSAITESPLFKRAGSEEAAVKAFSSKLVDFAKANQSDPMYKAGSEWYEKFTPMLQKEFGPDAELMAELLASTSPQTNVETNFAYALDALEGFKSGRFTKTIAKFNQGMDMLANDTWRGWYAKELKNIPEPPKEPTPAAFLEHWIFKHGLKPRQSNGKLYGQHSLPVLQVFARKWLDTARGPKTLNFVENLLGKSHEATIDLWADRTMRRIGYEGKDRWRILPKNQAGVSDTDFAFSQKAFRAAADQLGIKPSALQGALWFAEKQLWANNGWSRLDLGDFRKEMEKLPLLRRGIDQRLTQSRLSAKVKPAETMNLDLIQPRATR